MALKTPKLLNEFYKKETKNVQVSHKILVLAHYIIFNTLSKIIPRYLVKNIFRNYIKLGFIQLKLTLKDSIIINHHLENYGQFLEIILKDVYKLKKLKKNSVVVDVGANIGLVSILAAKRFNAKKVISFEPCSDNFILLKKNIEVNDCKNIIINKFAISDKKGKTKLYLHGSGTHSLVRKGKKFELVKQTTLDEVLKNEPVIDLLKIDVEGAELKVLKGANKTLEKTKKIAMELSRLCSHDEILQILKNKGFDVEINDNILIAYRR